MVVGCIIKAGQLHSREMTIIDNYIRPGRDEIGYLRYDPLPYLASAKDPALDYHAGKFLLGRTGLSADSLRELREPARICRAQLPDGSWKFAERNCTVKRGIDYSQVEIFRHLGILVEKYCFDKSHPALKKAAGYIFSCQTEEGDFRGTLGIHYAPEFTAMIMELLIKAGYGDSPEITAAFEWLESMRQHDGGWAWPLKTRGISFTKAFKLHEPVEPNRSKPFSHCLTGIILRAYAAHETMRKSDAALIAADLLADRFFLPDKYTDRGKAEYWAKVTFPFWYTDIVTALDSLSIIGLSSGDSRIARAIDYVLDCQNPDGSFDFKLLRDGDKLLSRWICLAIAKIMKRLPAGGNA